MSPQMFEDGQYLTINSGPDDMNASCRMITRKVAGATPFDYELETVALEDTVHPVELMFEPPHAELAVDTAAEAFQMVWEKLTYAFRLPDPAQFPALDEITDEDREKLRHYTTVCRKLAGYSALSFTGAFTVKWTARAGVQEQWMGVEFPPDEQMVALATRFRQLNNERDKLTAFSSASGTIMRLVRDRPDLAPVVKQWREARAALLNRTLSTVVCSMLLPVHAMEYEPPIISYGNRKPSDLFTTFFYADLLHVTDSVADLVEIQSDEGNGVYHLYGFLSSVLALTHLYLGFAVLVEHALGDSG